MKAVDALFLNNPGRFPTLIRNTAKVGLLSFVVAALACSLATAAELTPFQLGGRTFVPIAENKTPFFSARLSLAPPPGQKKLTRLCVLFGADAEGNGYWLEVGERRWSLASMSGGKKSVLAQGGHRILPVKGPVDVLIKRRLWLVTVALNGIVIAEVGDDSHGAGLVAVDAASSSPAADPIVQEVEGVEFAENFTRTEEELDLAASKVWRIARGNWRVHSVREDADMINVEALPETRRPQAAHSPNPFCVSGFAEDNGLLWAGYWFWDDYDASVSVRNRGVGAVGLAFHVVDAENFFLLRWQNISPILRATPIELLQVKGGKSIPLARAWVNAQTDQWYNIGVRTCGTRIIAFLDGAEIMDVTNAESLGGGIGVYVAGGDKKTEAYFDDVSVRTIHRLDYTNETWLRKHATVAGGLWDFAPVKRAGRPESVAPALLSRNGMLVLGAKSWPAPVLRAWVNVPQGGEEVGFVAGLGDRKRKHWRVTLERSGDSLALDLREEGKKGRGKLGSCRDVPLPEGRYVELCADFTREGEIGVYVDSDLWLRATRQDPVEGASAIFGQGARGARFYDLSASFEREEDKERLPAEQIFRDDPFMRHWSSAQGAWWPDEKEKEAFWHVSDFYGRSDVEIPLDGKITFIHSATSLADDGGYVLKQEKVTPEEGEAEGPEFYSVAFLRLGEEIEKELVNPEEAEAGKIVLHKDGPYVWLTVGAKEVFCFRDREPLPGTKVAVTGLTAEGLANLTIHRYKVRDYYFERALTDWHSVGRWVVTNRFSCDPRWSHMATLTSSAGTLFNKFQYSGDVTVEAFMGMKMRPEGYIRIGDLNLALTTRPFDLSSGYCFVVAGWDPFWSERATYLLKRNKHVAFNDERLLPSARKPGEGGRVLPVPWIAAGRPVHGAWYYMKARKQGKKIDFYVDNHKAYAYVDPVPIKTFSPAVWTYDARIVVAKVKISYQKLRIPGRLVPPPEEEPVTEPAALAPLLVSATHPGFSDDFEGGLRGWKKSDDLHGAEPIIVRRRGGGHCLEITNIGSGGNFGVDVPVNGLALNAGRLRTLSFDYRIPPGVKTNLYLDVGGDRYFVRLTGPRDSGGLLKRLGEIDVKADGQWHSARFELAAAYRELQPEAADAATIARMVLGNMHRGLLEAGIGGNATGASYRLDNFALCSPGGGHFEAALGQDTPESVETLVAVDHNPATTPTKKGPPKAESLAAGQWFCHVRAKLKDGTLTATAHLPFQVVGGKLDAVPLTPADGGRWGYGPIHARFGPAALLLLDKTAVKFTVNGKEVESKAEVLRFDYEEGLLAIDMARAGLDMPDGKPCVLALAWTNLDGSPGTAQAQYTASLKDDATPPSVVELADLPMPNDFEADLGLWQGSDYGRVMRDNSTAASGQWSLMVQNVSRASPFLVYWQNQGFSAGKIPILEFDYKVHDAVMVDFMAANALGTCTIGFTDKSGYGRLLGSVENIHADNRWHHAEFNLLKLLRTSRYTPGLFHQHYLALGDNSFRACAPGAYYHLDNFRPVPLISGDSGETLAWHAWDAGGIKGYSYLWSTEPTDMPDDTVDAEAAGCPLKGLPVPTAYLHVKACDKAGNWGPVAHYRFLVDSAAPVVSVPSPAAGAKAAPPSIAVTIQDECSAVDPEGFKVTIDGRPYTPSSKGVLYDLDTGRFTWDWVKGAPADQASIPNGKTVKVEVAAADFAGNKAKTFAWEWVMDYSKDRYPPSVPVIACETMPVFHLDNFETNTGQWKNQRGDVWGARVTRVARDAARGDYCLKLSALRAGGFLNALALSNNYDLTKYPVLSFDYLISAYTRVNLQVCVNGQWYELLMTSPKTAYHKLGKAEGINADGKWHHYVIDLRGLIKQVQPSAKTYTVSQITFGDPARTGNKANAYWMIDDFLVSAYGEPAARFTWTSRDITGISGYGVSFVQDGEAAVDKKVTAKQGKGTFKAAQGGMFYLRVRACDAAGNWSDVASYPYYVKEAPKPQPATPAPG